MSQRRGQFFVYGKGKLFRGGLTEFKDDGGFLEFKDFDGDLKGDFGRIW